MIPAWIRVDQQTTIHRSLRPTPTGKWEHLNGAQKTTYVERLCAETERILGPTLAARLTPADVDRWLAGRPGLFASTGGSYWHARWAGARLARGTLTHWLTRATAELETRLDNNADLATLAARLKAQANAEAEADRAASLAEQAPRLAVWAGALAAEALAAAWIWRRNRA